MTRPLAILLAATAALFAAGCGPTAPRDVAELDLGAGLWRAHAGGWVSEDDDLLLEKVRALAARDPETGNTDAGEAATPAVQTAEAPAPFDSRPGPRHVLVPGDEVDVVVSGRGEFSGVLSVREDGTIVIPAAGDLVQAAGKSPEELAKAVADCLHPRYLKHSPSVSAVVRSSPKWTYHVFGAVARQGRYDLPPGGAGIRILDALLEANGHEPFRSPGFSMVHIVTPDGEGTRVEVFDAAAALRGGRGASELLRPGSLIIVPERAGPLSEAELKREHYSAGRPGGGR